MAQGLLLSCWEAEMRSGLSAAAPAPGTCFWLGAAAPWPSSAAGKSEVASDPSS